MNWSILAERALYVACGIVVGWTFAQLEVFMFLWFQRRQRWTDERPPLI